MWIGIRIRLPKIMRIRIRNSVLKLQPPPYAFVICYFSDDKICCSDFGLGGMSSCLRPPSLKSKFSCFFFIINVLNRVSAIALLYLNASEFSFQIETHRVHTETTALLFFCLEKIPLPVWPLRLQMAENHILSKSKFNSKIIKITCYL
jgi:hypothetical protein